jgi:hypothetical protein
MAEMKDLEIITSLAEGFRNLPVNFLEKVVTAGTKI